MKPPIDNGTILITGASAGIGRELARQLAPRASTLMLVARRVDRLVSLQRELTAAYPGLRVDLLPCDLSDSVDVDALLDDVTQQDGAVDVLVNNAGVGDLALYDQADWARIERMIKINVVAMAKLTHRLVEPMVTHGRGGILNISSGAGIAIMPGAATYVGTKHFVTGFTETLQAELARTGVIVTQVLPGPVQTEFDEAAGISGLVGGPPQFLRISAAQCAREAVAGFDRGQAMVFPGRAYRTLMILQGLLPRVLQRFIARSTARRLRRARTIPAPTAALPALLRTASTISAGSAGSRGSWRDRAMRVLNHVPILLLRSPLHRLLSSGVLLLSFTGRRSGKTYTLPVNFLRTDDTILITTDSPWWKNLRGGRRVRVRIQGQTFEGMAEAVTEERAIAEALRAMIQRFPHYGRFANIRRRPDGQPDAGDMLQAIRRGRVLVRVQLLRRSRREPTARSEP